EVGAVRVVTDIAPIVDPQDALLEGVIPVDPEGGVGAVGGCVLERSIRAQTHANQTRVVGAVDRQEWPDPKSLERGTKGADAPTPECGGPAVFRLLGPRRLLLWSGLLLRLLPGRLLRWLLLSWLLLTRRLLSRLLRHGRRHP